jgi:hypothetical protein
MKQHLYILMILASGAAMSQNAVNTTTIQSRPVANSNAPEITFTETTHDFGTLKKGVPVGYKFVYKNTGKEALVLHDCRVGCHCTTAKCLKEPVQPGKTGFIEVHYDSTRVGAFSKEILVASNARNPVLTLVIKGVIIDTESGNVEASKDEERMKTSMKKKVE